MPASFLLAVMYGALLQAPAPSAVPEPAQPTSDPMQFTVGLLSSPGLDSAALRDALHLRLPRLELRTEWAPGEGEGRVFISVRPTPDGAAVRTDVIAEDGRGYSRRLEVPPDDERRIASVLANLLFSIEEAAVPADVEDVVVPETSAAEDVDKAVESVENPETPEPRPEPQLDPEPTPEPPTPKPPTPSTTPEDPPTPVAPSPRWRVGVPLTGGVLLPLGGPRFGPLLQGGGLGLGVDAEHARGAQIGLRLRYLARDLAPFRLSRLRFAVGAGYGWTLGVLRLPLRGELAVEPWWVVHGGDRLSATRLGAPPGGTVALGGAVHFEPAVVLPTRAGPLQAVRLGIDLGLGGSLVVDDGARVATVTSGLEDAELDELFRVGGMELWLGARIGMVFGRRSTPP